MQVIAAVAEFERESAPIGYGLVLRCTFDATQNLGQRLKRCEPPGADQFGAIL